MKRIFLDTNVYIVGADNLKSNEGLILTWLGFQRKKRSDVEVVASNELLEQVARVAKRIT